MLWQECRWCAYYTIPTLTTWSFSGSVPLIPLTHIGYAGDDHPLLLGNLTFIWVFCLRHWCDPSNILVLQLAVSLFPNHLFSTAIPEERKNAVEGKQTSKPWRYHPEKTKGGKTSDRRKSFSLSAYFNDTDKIKKKIACTRSPPHHTLSRKNGFLLLQLQKYTFIWNQRKMKEDINAERTL